MKKVITLVLVLLVMVTISASAVAEYTPVLGKIYHNSVEVGNVFDNRVTITTGEILFPGVGPGNYTKKQLDKIAETWVEFTIYPNGMMPMVFAGGLIANGKTYNAGVAAYIGGKPQVVRVRNGELVLWSLLEDLHADIRFRMEPQIRQGNLDIHHELAFKACSPEIAGYFTPELLKNNGVKIVNIAE